jgi:16S rRNA (uracil1498-N3)-methyltransferase
MRGDDARHLTRVLRAEAGQVYEISDGRSAYLAEIVEARGERALFRVIEAVASPVAPVRVTLCAALIKFDHFEWLIEKATELGVEKIQPVEAARSERGLLEASRKRNARWSRIAHEAGQQSRRLAPPEILPALSMARALETAATCRIFLDEAGAPPLLNTLPQHRAEGETAALMIGPEGGWTDPERALALQAGWTAASLGPFILRAETAAAASLAVILNAWIP